MKLNIFVGKLNDCMDDVTTSILDLVSATFEEPSLPITEFLAKQMTILKVEYLFQISVFLHQLIFILFM